MADANAGGNDNFNPVEARTFLQGFGHKVDTISDTDLPTVYTTAKGHFDTATKTAVETAIKERGEFGPNWRQAIAGDDQDALKTLERFQHPKEIYKSFNELRTKQSKGELKALTPFPEKGTPEQQTAWRAENGIPEKPEGYEVKPPEGVVIGEEDKPFIDGFLKHAHSRNMSNAVVNDAIAWWGEERVRRQEAAAQQTAELKKTTSDTLHAEWGTEYRPTINRIEGLLSATVDDADLRESIKASVETNPGFAKFLANVAIQLNPTSTLTPGDGAAQIGSITEWLSKADKTMRTDRKTYDKTMAPDYPKYAAAYKRQTGKDWGR